MSESGEVFERRLHQEGGDNDPYEEMVIFLTGKRKHERKSKERAIRFPVKVRTEFQKVFSNFILLLPYILMSLHDSNDNQLMYAAEECSNYSHIISWKIKEPDEHHLVIADVHEFAEKVLPALFKVAKYDSFERKLYRWGFIKTHRSKAEKEKYDPNSASYFHKSFRKGNYSLAAQMTCSGMEVDLYKKEQKDSKRKQQSEDTNTRTSTSTNIHDDSQFPPEFPNDGSSHASLHGNTMSIGDLGHSRFMPLPCVSITRGTSHLSYDHQLLQQENPVSDMNIVNNDITLIDRECEEGCVQNGSISSTCELDDEAFLRIEDLSGSSTFHRKDWNYSERREDEELVLFHQLQGNIANRQSLINAMLKDILEDPLKE
ncbi:hypothetical protein CTEN210_01254 [Chaetoceros tenuissimus]|uniref:HSF-type DNA-binding domain-containing protein n=1 Tax=Chaetoceros tenuissimus TaxID=426638 RepID=A0AAD3GZH3_9STRA|nr:hypothetical protein CTEN210_01254 [Chaetoceros tenuissimus]